MDTAYRKLCLKTRTFDTFTGENRAGKGAEVRYTAEVHTKKKS